MNMEDVVKYLVGPSLLEGADAADVTVSRGRIRVRVSGGGRTIGHVSAPVDYLDMGDGPRLNDGAWRVKLNGGDIHEDRA
mgnify:FL=1